MKRTHLIIPILGLTLLAFASAEARGLGEGSGRGGMKGGFHGAMAEELSTETKEKIHELHSSFLEETLELRTELYGEQEKMKLLMMDADSSDDDILNTYERANDLKTQLEKKRFENMLKIRKELPEEMRGRGMRMGMHGDKHGGRGHFGRSGGGFGHGQGFGSGGCGQSAE